MTDYDDQIIAEFRANAGRVGGHWAGRDLLLLTTTGRKSGTQHTTPVAYTPDGDRLLVYGSNNGGQSHPGWYFNLLAEPASSSRSATSGTTRRRHRSRGRSVGASTPRRPNGFRPSPNTRRTPSA